MLSANVLEDGPRDLETGFAGWKVAVQGEVVEGDGDLLSAERHGNKRDTQKQKAGLFHDVVEMVSAAVLWDGGCVVSAPRPRMLGI